MNKIKIIVPTFILSLAIMVGFYSVCYANESKILSNFLNFQKKENINLIEDKVKKALDEEFEEYQKEAEQDENEKLNQIFSENKKAKSLKNE